MRRGPHTKWLGSVSFNGVVKGFLHYRFAGVGRSTIVGVQLEEDGPMVEEFRLVLGLAACHVAQRW
jgi:hypothetical protein